MVTSIPPEPTNQTVSRRRWVKVDVDEETFLRLHDSANKSRMKVSTYVRTMLDEGYVYNHIEVPFAAATVNSHS